MSVAPAGWRRDAVLAALVLGALAALAWLRPLMLPDEGRYAGVAWEMLRSGDWLTPRLDGLPYFHKPPLFYWVDAAAMALFGANPWAARAAPLLGAWVAALALYFFVRRWWGERPARLALVALLAQPLFYVGGQFANLDMLVAGCITLTIVLLAHAALSFERGQRFRGALLAAWAAAALGVLAKGLIGVVIPALVIGGWVIARRRWRTLAALLWLPAVLLFALLALPWFLLMQQRYPGFFDYFFVEQHFRRFAASGFNNALPFWFYVVLLLLASLPWLPWLRLQLRRGRLGGERGELRLLMLIWVAAVVLFFSLPRSKLVGYILPALPPLALLIGDGYESWREARQAKAPDSCALRRGWQLAAGCGVAISLAVIAIATLRPTRSNEEIAQLLRAQRMPGEPVYMLGDYHFDVPLLAGLTTPVAVVLDWSDPEISRRDTWRKELADAASFATPARRGVLMQPDRLQPALCAGGAAWLIGSAKGPREAPWLAGVPPLASVRGVGLWRLDVAAHAAIGCAVAAPDAALPAAEQAGAVGEAARRPGVVAALHADGHGAR